MYEHKTLSAIPKHISFRPQPLPILRSKSQKSLQYFQIVWAFNSCLRCRCVRWTSKNFSYLPTSESRKMSKASSWVLTFDCQSLNAFCQTALIAWGYPASHPPWCPVVQREGASIGSFSWSNCDPKKISTKGKWTVESEFRILTLVTLHIRMGQFGARASDCFVSESALAILQEWHATSTMYFLRWFQTKGTSMGHGSLKHNNFRAPNVIKVL